MSQEFAIEADGKSYVQRYLSSEDGLELQLMVAKVGFEPLLESLASMAQGEEDLREVLTRAQNDVEFQGQLLFGLKSVIDKLELHHIKRLKQLLFPVTFIERPAEEGGAKIPLSSVPNHFSSIADNRRLFVLLGKSLAVQLRPLFSGLGTPQI